MSRKPRILAFAGSTRKDSFNKKLVKIAAKGAGDAGADVTLIDLRDFPMPVYDGDFEVENGKPDNAKKFKKMMVEHHGFLISAPEYNSSITGVLKNSIDWVSRPDEEDGEKSLVAFRGKVVTLMSASPGGLGGLRGLVHVRSILGNIGCLVLPDQISISSAFKAFKEDGSLADEKQHQRVLGLGKTLTDTLGKLA